MDYRKLLHHEEDDLQASAHESAAELEYWSKPDFEGAMYDDRIYTINDIYSLPEGVIAELIGGKLYFKGTPKAIHQSVSGEVYFDTVSYIRERGGDCEVFFPPYGVYLHGDDSTYVIPDLTIVCDPDKRKDDGCFGAPDWVVEVISKSTQKIDYGLKLFLYREAGVREYWIINPANRTVMVYVFERGREDADLYSFDDAVPCHVFPGLAIRLSDRL